MKRTLLFLLAGCLFTLLRATEPTHHVMLIMSGNNEWELNEPMRLVLQDELADKGIKARVSLECLDADGRTYGEEKAAMRLCCLKAREEQVELIVTLGDEAFFSLWTCGDSLPMQLPVVFTKMKYPNPELLKQLPGNVCGFTATTSYLDMLQEARRLFPDRTEIISLVDSSYLNRVGHAQLSQDFKRFQDKNPQYSLTDINLQSNTLRDIILSLCITQNARNKLVIVPRWSSFTQFVGRNSKAPLFTNQRNLLKEGPLCIYDAEYDECIRQAAQCAAQIFQGSWPGDLGVNNISSHFVYDYKQLQFFQVDVAKAERKGEIRNVPWMERYGSLYITLSIVLLSLLTGGIVWLVRINRREARRRTQDQIRLALQQQLVEQRDELDDIFCSIRDGLITYDLDLHIRIVNRPLLEMLQLQHTDSVDSYEHQKVGSIFSLMKDGKNILVELLQKVIDERRPVLLPDKVFMYAKQRDIHFPVKGEVVPIDANGQVTGVALVCHNVSEEETETLLFNMALEESSIYPWKYDIPHDSLIIRSSSGETFTVPLTQLNLFVCPLDIEVFRSYLDEMKHGILRNERIQVRVLHPQSNSNDYLWWEFRSTIGEGMQESAPFQVMGIAQNIQNFKDREEELIEMRDRALQADKLKSSFMANMSHEIRTPLNAIVGFAGLLKNPEMFSQEEFAQFIDTIDHNCTLLLALISDVLDLSRIEAGTMSFQIDRYNLNDIIREVQESHIVGMPEGVELQLALPEGDDLMVDTDLIRLKQVLNNLLNNAKKFTTQGYVRVGFECPDPLHVTLFVEDTGRGISEEGQRHIFERFFKEDSFTQGAGLGLSICETIVERLHGTITVRSTLGRGTCFRVMMPVEQPKEEVEDAAN